MSINRNAMIVAREAVQTKINWLKEECERLEAWMRATSDPPRECATCKKQGHCSGPASGRPQTGCGFWSAREEEQE